MTDQTTGSTGPRRQLGRYLRELRAGQRITVKTAGEAGMVRDQGLAHRKRPDQPA